MLDNSPFACGLVVGAVSFVSAYLTVWVISLFRSKDRALEKKIAKYSAEHPFDPNTPYVGKFLEVWPGQRRVRVITSGTERELYSDAVDLWCKGEWEGRQSLQAWPFPFEGFDRGMSLESCAIHSLYTFERVGIPRKP